MHLPSHWYQLASAYRQTCLKEGLQRCAPQTNHSVIGESNNEASSEVWVELRKGRTGQPEVDGWSLVSRREDSEYFFLLSLLSHLSVSRPNTDVWKEKSSSGDDCVRVATLFGFWVTAHASKTRKVEDSDLFKHFRSKADSEVCPKIALQPNNDLLPDIFCLKTRLSPIGATHFCPYVPCKSPVIQK